MRGYSAKLSSDDLVSVRDDGIELVGIVNKKEPNGIQLGLEQTIDDSCATFSSDVSSAPGTSTVYDSECVKNNIKLNKAFCNIFSKESIENRKKLIKDHLDSLDNISNKNISTNEFGVLGTEENLDDVIFLKFLNKVICNGPSLTQDKTTLEEFYVIPALFIRVHKKKFVEFLSVNGLIRCNDKNIEKDDSNNEVYSNEYISNLILDLIISGTLKFIQKQEGSNNKFCRYCLIAEHSNIKKYVLKRSKYYSDNKCKQSIDKKEFPDGVSELVCSIPKRRTSLSNQEVQQKYQLNCSELSLASFAYSVFADILSKIPSIDPVGLMRNSADAISPFLERQKDLSEAKILNEYIVYNSNENMNLANNLMANTLKTISSKIQDIGPIGNDNIDCVKDRIGDVADSDKVCLTDELNAYTCLTDDVGNRVSVFPVEISGCDKPNNNLLSLNNIYQTDENNGNDNYNDTNVQSNIRQDNNISKGSPSMVSDEYEEFANQISIDGNVSRISSINQYINSNFLGSEITELTDINEIAKYNRGVDLIEEITILSDDIEDITNKVGETKKEILTPIGIYTGQNRSHNSILNITSNIQGELSKSDTFNTDILFSSAKYSRDQTKNNTIYNIKSTEDTLVPNDPTELATRDNTDADFNTLLGNNYYQKNSISQEVIQTGTNTKSSKKNEKKDNNYCNINNGINILNINDVITPIYRDPDLRSNKKMPKAHSMGNISGSVMKSMKLVPIKKDD